jgi:hypothetical protein
LGKEELRVQALVEHVTTVGAAASGGAAHTRLEARSRLADSVTLIGFIVYDGALHGVVVADA